MKCWKNLRYSIWRKYCVNNFMSFCKISVGNNDAVPSVLKVFQKIKKNLRKIIEEMSGQIIWGILLKTHIFYFWYFFLLISWNDLVFFWSWFSDMKSPKFLFLRHSVALSHESMINHYFWITLNDYPNRFEDCFRLWWFGK